MDPNILMILLLSVYLWGYQILLGEKLFPCQFIKSYEFIDLLQERAQGFHQLLYVLCIIDTTLIALLPCFSCLGLYLSLLFKSLKVKSEVTSLRLVSSITVSQCCRDYSVYFLSHKFQHGGFCLVIHSKILPMSLKIENSSNK